MVFKVQSATDVSDGRSLLDLVVVNVEAHINPEVTERSQQVVRKGSTDINVVAKKPDE
jgi:hypothetical protein